MVYTLKVPNAPSDVDFWCGCNMLIMSSIVNVQPMQLESTTD